MTTADHQRRGLLADLARRQQLLGNDELRVIDRVQLRIELGRERYGELDLSKPRDWRKERMEERLDALVYDVCEEIAAEDRERADLRGETAEALIELARTQLELIAAGKTAAKSRHAYSLDDAEAKWEALCRDDDRYWAAKAAHDAALARVAL